MAERRPQHSYNRRDELVPRVEKGIDPSYTVGQRGARPNDKLWCAWLLLIRSWRVGAEVSFGARYESGWACQRKRVGSL
jgi:hypothetical protein